MMLVVVNDERIKDKKVVSFSKARGSFLPVA